MKIFRTVFLPLLLCSVILLSGYFSPLLFDRLTPDLRNKAEYVSIAAADSPMYLENTEEVILPPWDEINMDQAGKLLETFAIADYEQMELSTYVNDHTAALFRTISTTNWDQFDGIAEAMRIHEDHLLFLQDYPCSFRFMESVEETHYMLDYVLDGRSIFPVCLHLKGEKTMPVEDETALRDSLEHIVSQVTYDFLHKDLNAVASLTYYMEDGEYTTPLTDAVLRLLSFNSSSYKVWLYILLNCQDIYTLTYQNETLLVMVDRQNLISCLFFDAATNQVTGYSIDPQLVSIYINLDIEP